MASFKHNKKRNSGLVYEFLVRRMTRQVLENDVKGFKQTEAIVKKYYSPGQPLAAERELFEIVRKTRGVSQAVAVKILAEVRKHIFLLDPRKVEIKKSNLLKEANHTFGKDFFSAHRVPDYRLLASIQILIDSVHKEKLPHQIGESVTRFQIEEALAKYMTSTEPKSQSHDDGKVDGLVCALAAKKFQERYGTILNKDQKTLLEKFMRAQMSGDQTYLVEYLRSEQARILSVLRSSEQDQVFEQDKIMKERLTDSIGKLEVLAERLGRPDDSVLEEMMLYHKLVEELRSNE